MRTTEQVRADIKLDFEQRQQAGALEDSVMDDPLAAAYEIFFLRDRVAELSAAVIAAERDMSALDLAAEPASLPLLRRALKEKVPRG